MKLPYVLQIMRRGVKARPTAFIYWGYFSNNLTTRPKAKECDSITFSSNNVIVPNINARMGIKPGDRILTIAGSGTHAISKLLADPKQVIAVDISAPQLHLAKLQAVGMRLLPRKDFCSMIGINKSVVPSTERIKLYQDIRHALEPDTVEFWDRHKGAIDDGVLYCGDYTKAYDKILKEIFLSIHDNSTIQHFLSLGHDLGEQRHFLEETWNTPKMSELFKKRFENNVSSVLSINMYEDVGVPLGILYLNQINNMLNHVPNNRNPSIEEILTGDITNGARLPAYLKESNFEFIKDRIDRIEWIEGDIVEYLQKCATTNEVIKFDGVNLSTIPTYCDETKVDKMMKDAVAVCKTGATLVYYTPFTEMSIQFPQSLLNGGLIKYDGQDLSCGIVIPRFATIQ